MIHYKTKEEIELMRHSALLVSQSLTEIAKILKPGIRTMSLDTVIGDYIRDHGAVPSFLNYRGYHNSCISVNDAVVWFPKANGCRGDIISSRYRRLQSRFLAMLPIRLYQ